jgi:hypothetical protein
MCGEGVCLSVCLNIPRGEGGVVWGWGFSQEANNFIKKCTVAAVWVVAKYFYEMSIMKV